MIHLLISWVTIMETLIVSRKHFFIDLNFKQKTHFIESLSSALSWQCPNLNEAASEDAWTSKKYLLKGYY